jgi:hypothetical protein
VYWEEQPERTREVVGVCKVCARYGEFWYGVTLGQDIPFHVVSPTGLAHSSSGDGVTDCGKDATGDDWWWRS